MDANQLKTKFEKLFLTNEPIRRGRGKPHMCEELYREGGTTVYVCRQHPRFVQNRCYARLGWDRQVREFCRAHGVVYQGFSLLTANRETLAAVQMAQIAARHQRTIPQIVFRFAVEVGMIPLTGTTDSGHMQAELEIFDFRLEPAEIAWIGGWDVR